MIFVHYFQTYVNHYFMQKSYHNKNNNNLKLDLLGKLLLDINIQNVEMKIRNISLLIDCLMQKYFGVEYVPNLDLLKFPRMNIVINRLYIEKIVFHEEDINEIINAIFEHFIITQFLLNYLKIKFKIQSTILLKLDILFFILILNYLMN
jgi:hypothetical protein